MRVRAALIVLSVVLLASTPRTRLYDRVHVGSILERTAALQRCPSRRGWACYAVRGTIVSGYVNPLSEDDGFLSNGQELLVVPLISGGSGGVFAALLYTRMADVPFRFVGYVPSPEGHLLIYLNGGDIVVQTPVYKRGDAQCCPSREHWSRYSLNGMRLQLLEQY